MLNSKTRLLKYENTTQWVGQRLLGRIEKYSPLLGYGYMSYSGFSIFFSSYNCLKGKDSDIRVGSLCSFVLADSDVLYDGQEQYIADEIDVISKYPVGNKIIVSDTDIHIGLIADFGICNGRLLLKDKFSEELLATKNPEHYKFLFISTRDGDEFRYFNTFSCIHGDGNINIYSEYNRLDHLLRDMSSIENVDSLVSAHDRRRMMRHDNTFSI